MPRTVACKPIRAWHRASYQARARPLFCCWHSASAGTSALVLASEMAIRVQGKDRHSSAGGVLGLQPHYLAWGEVRSLVTDGVAFSKQRWLEGRAVGATTGVGGSVNRAQTAQAAMGNRKKGKSKNKMNMG